MNGERILWTFMIVLAAIMAAIAVYRAWPLLHPEVVAVAPLNPACDLRHGACVDVFPRGGQAHFRIEPHALPVAQPLRFEVRSVGLHAKEVEVDFIGVDMNMGFNRASLHATAPNHFIGTGMLPVCVRTRMDWEARVLLHTDAGLLVAPFRFVTN
jgi:hypothetical protein